MNKVELFVNKQIYDGFTSVKIKRSIKAVAGSFDLSVTNSWSEQKKAWFIAPLDEVVVKIDGITVITGFVDTISSGFDGSNRTISISGRDKTADLVDCSHDGPLIYDGITLKALITKLISPFGLIFKSEVAISNTSETFQAQQGETIFVFLERVLKLKGLFLSSTPQGELVINAIASKRSKNALIEGVNILNCDFSFDSKERFSKYIVRGQGQASEEFDMAQVNHIEAVEKDSDVKRYRPIIIIADTAMDQGLAKQRARWERITRSAKSSNITVKVIGWKRQDGSIWFPNEVVNFQSKYFGFNLDLLVSDVSYEQSSSGTVTTLLLESEEAYKQGALKPVNLWRELNPPTTAGAR